MTGPTRVLSGLLAAALIALAGRRARALSASGATAAVLIGTAAVAAGWDWGALLIVFFLASSVLSRVRREQKETTGGGIAAKGDERDAVQVLANGGVFALAAVVFLMTGNEVWQAVGVGALAAATADTWATEIGMLAPWPPRSIATFRIVAPGTSGGVTLLGTLGTVLGAAFIELVAIVLRWPEAVAVAALAGGIAGSLADSMLGALVQQRRWCDVCDKPTERRVHGCGAPTRIVGGVSWVDNDLVNAACTVVGGVVAALILGRL